MLLFFLGATFFVPVVEVRDAFTAAVPGGVPLLVAATAEEEEAEEEVEEGFLVFDSVAVTVTVSVTGGIDSISGTAGMLADSGVNVSCCSSTMCEISSSLSAGTGFLFLSSLGAPQVTSGVEAVVGISFISASSNSSKSFISSYSLSSSSDKISFSISSGPLSSFSTSCGSGNFSGVSYFPVFILNCYPVNSRILLIKRKEITYLPIEKFIH